MQTSYMICRSPRSCCRRCRHRPGLVLTARRTGMRAVSEGQVRPFKLIARHRLVDGGLVHNWRLNHLVRMGIDRVYVFVGDDLLVHNRLHYFAHMMMRVVVLLHVVDDLRDVAIVQRHGVFEAVAHFRKGSLDVRATHRLVLVGLGVEDLSVLHLEVRFVHNRLDAQLVVIDLMLVVVHFGHILVLVDEAVLLHDRRSKGGVYVRVVLLPAKELPHLAPDLVAHFGLLQGLVTLHLDAIVLDSSLLLPVSRSLLSAGHWGTGRVKGLALLASDEGLANGI